MVEYRVQRKNPSFLDKEGEIIVTKTISDIVRKDSLRVLAYQICSNHIHIVIVCEEKDISKVVQKMKSMSARQHNIAKGRTIPATGEHAPLLNVRGETQSHLWAKGFSSTYIDSEEHLLKVITYVENNRIKHGLPDNNALQSFVAKMLTPLDKAFEPG